MAYGRRFRSSLRDRGQSWPVKLFNPKIRFHSHEIKLSLFLFWYFLWWKKTRQRQSTQQPQREIQETPVIFFASVLVVPEILTNSDTTPALRHSTKTLWQFYFFAFCNCGAIIPQPQACQQQPIKVWNMRIKFASSTLATGTLLKLQSKENVSNIGYIAYYCQGLVAEKEHFMKKGGSILIPPRTPQSFVGRTLPVKYTAPSRGAKNQD